MVKRNYNQEFKFWCCTENPTDIRSEVNIIPLHTYDLEKWWWKLWFFSKEFPVKGKCLYFDLDTIIQNNITDLVNYNADNPHFVEGRVWWRNGRKNGTAYRINSSVILWDLNNINSKIWENFYPKREYYINKYGSEDNYLEKEFKDYVKTIPIQWVYSRLMGFDDSDPDHFNDKYRPKTVYDKVTDEWYRLYYMPDRMLCLLNGTYSPSIPTCVRGNITKGLEKYWE
jgi:hypothetical protein